MPGGTTVAQAAIGNKGVVDKKSQIGNWEIHSGFLFSPSTDDMNQAGAKPFQSDGLNDH